MANRERKGQGHGYLEGAGSRGGLGGTKLLAWKLELDGGEEKEDGKANEEKGIYITKLNLSPWLSVSLRFMRFLFPGSCSEDDFLDFP